MRKILILLTVIFSFACEKENFQPTPQITESSITREEIAELIPKIKIDLFGFRDEEYGSFRFETAKYFVNLGTDNIYPQRSRDEHAVVRTKIWGGIPYYKSVEDTYYNKRFYLLIYEQETSEGMITVKQPLTEEEVYQPGGFFLWSPSVPDAFIGDRFVRFTFHTNDEWDNPYAYVVTATEVTLKQ